jgi:hypothetical protein
MLKVRTQQLLLAASLAVVAWPAAAQKAPDPARAGDSIAGKAAERKAAPAKAAAPRKRYEFAAAQAAPATPAPARATPALAVMSEKSHCHHGSSDV